MSVDSSLGELLKEYLPKQKQEGPFVTLTYACSIDSRISSGPGVRTTISHEQTKDMTQYLRYHHDAIVIGGGTARADDPGLNCKYPGSRGTQDSPRPFIIDPSGQWEVTMDSKIVKLVQQGLGKAPYIITTSQGEDAMEYDHIRLIKTLGGKIIVSDKCFGHGGYGYASDPYFNYHPTLSSGPSRSFDWPEIIKIIGKTGAKSIMIEGGGKVINSVLEQSCFDSLVVTIGPLYLGARGVEVSPGKAVRLSTPKWWTGIQDSVMCAKRDPNTRPNARPNIDRGNTGNRGPRPYLASGPMSIASLANPSIF